MTQALTENSVIIIFQRDESYNYNHPEDNFSAYYLHKIFDKTGTSYELNVEEYVKEIFTRHHTDAPYTDNYPSPTSIIRITHNLYEEDPKDLVEMYDNFFLMHKNNTKQKKLDKLAKEKEENELYRKKVYLQLKEEFETV